MMEFMENVVYLPTLRLSRFLSELASSISRREPSEALLDMLSQKCCLRLLAALQDGEVRFNALVRVSGGSANTVRLRLAELAEAGVVERTVLRQMPPSVIINLTAKGRELVSILAGLSEWQARWSREAPSHAAISMAAESRKPYRPV